MPGIKANIETEVRDSSGNVIEKRRFPMKSFCDAFAVMIGCLMTNLWQDAKDYLNAAKTAFGFQSGTTVVGAAGDSQYGIVVGEDDNAYDHAQYYLASLIAHGTGAGQLEYGAEHATNPTWNGSTKWQWEKYRVFSNTSGGSVTIKEIGLMSKSTGPALLLLGRDVPSPIVVADSQSIKITYSFELTK